MNNPLRHESVSQSSYAARTPEYYLRTIDPEIRSSFTPKQMAAIQDILAIAIPKPAPKLVDLRFSVDLVFSRFYLVLFVGKDRRKQSRSYLPEPLVRLGNSIAALVLLIGLNLLISLVIVLLAYLIKSAIGIDFFPSEHLADQVEKLT